jgi:hypothetical protein
MKKLDILDRIKKIGGFIHDYEVATEVLQITPQNLSNMKRRGSLRSRYVEIIDWAVRERISLDYIFGLAMVQLQALQKFRNGQKVMPAEEFDEVAALAFRFWDLMTNRNPEIRNRSKAIFKAIIEAHYWEEFPSKKKIRERERERERENKKGGK